MTADRMPERQERGPVGRALRMLFVGFNCLMPCLILLVWVWIVVDASLETACERSPFDLERHSDICANLFPYVAFMVMTAFLFGLWALGAVLLGALSHLTRGRPAAP